MRREHMIRVRASEDELERLVTHARNAGMTLSSYLRWRGLQAAAPQPARRTPKTTTKPKRTSR